MKKIELHLCSFGCLPTRSIELEPERILANDVVLPWENHPHKVRLFVIGNEFGALGAVWADCEQNAFDELVDAGLGDGLLIEEADADEETARLGNGGEPADMAYAWIQLVDLSREDRCPLLCKFAEARGLNANTLDDIL